MNFYLEAIVNCSVCEKGRSTFEQFFEQIEHIDKENFEDAAIDHFREHGWEYAKLPDDWTCPECAEKNR